MALAFCLLAAVSCGDAKKRLQLGGSCTLNSDCIDPLVCKFGACHAACVVSRDCEDGALCVRVDGVGVCQLPREQSCGDAGTCPAPLVCRTADNSCRNSCGPSAPCPPDQVCAGTYCVTSVDGGSGDGPRKVEDGGRVDSQGLDSTPADAASPDARVPPIPDAEPTRDAGVWDAPVKAPPLVEISSGSGRLTSAHYKLDLFVSPAQPVTTISSARYSLTIGSGWLLGTR